MPVATHTLVSGKDNKRNGQGTFTYAMAPHTFGHHQITAKAPHLANGDTYVGEFKDGQT
jgi:hypothetical protein